MDPKVNHKSVWAVIPTWNRKDDLINCIDSLIKSDYQYLQIVVIDNASTDGTVSAINNQFPAVNIIELDKNTGAAYASNRGFDLALAKGADYIIRLDSDIVVDPRLIGELVHNINTLPDAGILFPKILRFDNPDVIWFTGAESHPFLLVSRVNNYNVIDNQSELIKEVDYVPSAVILVTAEALKLTGGFDEHFFVYSEDFDLCLRLKKLGYKIFYVPTAKAWHKIGSEKLNKWGVEQFYRGKILFYTKNTVGIHRVLLIIYAFCYAFYRFIIHSSHEPLLPAMRGLISGLKSFSSISR